MANQREIKVGSRDFVVRVAGEDVPVEVVAKVEGAEGGRPEWQLRNLKTGRTLTRGSAAIRRAGEPAKQAPAGFGRRPAAPAPAHQLQQPATFGSQFGSSQPFGSKPATFGSHVRRAEPKAGDGSLGSLRGKIKVPSRPVPSPAAAPIKSNSEEERQPRRRASEHYPSDLVRDMCEALKRTSGTEYEVRNVFANVLAEYNNRRFYPGFPSGV